MANKFVDKGDYQDLYSHIDSTGLIYLIHNRLVTVGLKTENFTSKDNFMIAFDGKILNYTNFDDVFKKNINSISSIIYDRIHYDSDTSYEFILYVYHYFLIISEKEQDGLFLEEFKINEDLQTTSKEEANLNKIMNDLALGTIDLITAFRMFFLTIIGDYAFILHDLDRQKTLICRGGIGLTPLYYGITQLGEFMVSSEKKTLIDDCIIIKPFPSNSFMYDKITGNIPITNQINPCSWDSSNHLNLKNANFEPGLSNLISFQIDDLLQKEINTNLSVNRLPYGVIVDGTLESKIMVKIMHTYSRDLYNQWGKRLHTFSIHLNGYDLHDSTREVLDLIQSVHYSYEYTIDQAWDILPTLIYILESTDFDLILRSLPLYFLLLKIKKTFHLKTIYHSLGPELFRDFTNRENIQKTFTKMSEKYGALTNKLPSSHGIEFEIPFMNRGILEKLYNLSDEYWNYTNTNTNTQKSENFHVFREFGRRLKLDDTSGEIEIKSERESLQTGLEYKVASLVTDQEFGTGLLLFADNPPKSKLEYYLRKLYLKHFGNK